MWWAKKKASKKTLFLKFRTFRRTDDSTDEEDRVRRDKTVDLVGGGRNDAVDGDMEMMDDDDLKVCFCLDEDKYCTCASI